VSLTLSVCLFVRSSLRWSLTLTINGRCFAYDCSSASLLLMLHLQPAQWQLSADGKRLVGHMTLRKPISDNDSVEGRAAEPGGAVGRGALGKKPANVECFLSLRRRKQPAALCVNSGDSAALAYPEGEVTGVQTPLRLHKNTALTR